MFFFIGVPHSSSNKLFIINNKNIKCFINLFSDMFYLNLKKTLCTYVMDEKRDSISHILQFHLTLAP